MELKRSNRTQYFLDSVAFLAVESINRGLPILILPLLTSFFSEADVGLYSSLTLGVSYLYVIINLSSHASINVQVGRTAGDSESQRDAVRNVILVLIGISLIIGSFFVLIAFIAGFFSRQSHWGELVALLCVAAMNQSLYVSAGAYYRSIGKRTLYFLLNLSNICIFLGVASFEILKLKWGSWSLIAASALGTGTALIFLITSLDLHRPMRVPKTFVLEILDFGWPIVITDLLNLTSVNVTRIFILATLGAATLAPYHVAFTVASVVSVIAQSFNMAYVPRFMASHFRRPGSEVLSDPIGTPTIIATSVSVGMILAAPYIAPLLFPPAYGILCDYIVFPLASFCILPAYFALTNALSVDSKTVRKKMISMIVSASTALILATVLSYFWGVWGALIAAPLGGIAGIIVNTVMVRRYTHYRMPAFSYIVMAIVTLVFADISRRMIANLVPRNYQLFSSLIVIVVLIGVLVMTRTCLSRQVFRGEAFEPSEEIKK